MAKKQRKNLMISSPLLFSLCCFSFSVLEAISFKEILLESELLVVTQEDPVSYDNLTNKSETAPLSNLLYAPITANHLIVTTPSAAESVSNENTLLISKKHLEDSDLVVLSENKAPIYDLTKNSITSSSHPIHIKTLNITTHQTSFVEDLKIFTHSIKPSLEPYINQTIISYISTPSINKDIDSSFINLAIKDAFDPSLQLFLKTDPINLYQEASTALPFQTDKVFLDYNLCIKPSLASSIYYKAPTPSIVKRFLPEQEKNIPIAQLEKSAFNKIAPCVEIKDSLLEEVKKLTTQQDGIFLNYNFSINEALLSYISNQATFEGNKVSLNKEFLISDTLLSYISSDMFTPHIKNTQTSKVILKKFKAEKQDFNISFQLEERLFDPSRENFSFSEKKPCFNSKNLIANRPFPYIESKTFFEKNIVFSNDTFFTDTQLISYIECQTTLPRILNIAIPKQKLVELKAQSQNIITNDLFKVCPDFYEEITLSLNTLMPDKSNYVSFSNTTSLNDFSLYLVKESFLKENRLFELENRLINPILMEDLNAVSPTKNIVSADFLTLNSLQPHEEPLWTIDLHSHLVLDNFYEYKTTKVLPFTSYKTTFFNDFVGKALFVAYEKKSFDNSPSLDSLSTFIETTGNQHSIISSLQNNTPFLSVKAYQENSIFPELFSNTNPDDLLTFYDLPADNTVFLPINVTTSVPFTENVSISLTKYSSSNCYYSLVLENDLLNNNGTISPSLHRDLSHDLKDLIPYHESPSLLAYQQSFSPDIQNNILLVDKTTITPQTSLQLFSEINHTTSLVATKVDLLPSRKKAATLNQSSRNTQENLSKLPSLHELQTLSLSEEFTIDLEITPNTKGKGYLFSINLEPVVDKLKSGSAQNFIFLVDRSSSIDKNRFQVFKQAISKALLYLKEEDTFNILTFDTEIAKMSHDSVYVDSSTKHSAKRFLETQRRGYKYVLPNLYNILLSVHSMTKNSPLPTTVILLTNGKTLENFNPQDELLSRLVSTNQYGFTLFTACSSQNNNTLMLEILSHLNKGEFMHSQTNAAFPRKLAAFVKHAGYLLAKDIHISAATPNSDINIEFFPDTSLAPNLYGDRPYTIVGKIDKLCDFDLVLQGRFCDNWLNITKKISFKTARNGGHSIYKNYTMQTAYNNYRIFLNEGNTAYLEEAKKVLQPFNSSIN